MTLTMGRWLFVIRFALGTTLLVVSVLTTLAVPGPLVPAAEGILFLGLLAWAQLEYASRRKDSPAYRDHLADLHAFARLVTDTALFMQARDGRFATTNTMSMSSPRAQDFRVHFPHVAEQVDQWNNIADGYGEASRRFVGLCHNEAERVTGPNDPTSFHYLLGVLGQGQVDAEAVIWRVENGRLEASWQLDIDREPAFSPIVTKNLTSDVVERVWQTVIDFPKLPGVQDWRTSKEAHDQLRPVLADSLERAEIAFELKGKCPHCPP
ncbi:MAG: hypothetical protein ACYDAL_17035 [Candidatus Dormibacteraceae bacterium]